MEPSSAERSPVERLCARPTCGAPAVATLSYDYSQRQAWLDDLSLEAEPQTHDLCDPHADGLVVPQAWDLDDRRLARRLERAMPLAG